MQLAHFLVTVILIDHSCQEFLFLVRTSSKPNSVWLTNESDHVGGEAGHRTNNLLVIQDGINICNYALI